MDSLEKQKLIESILRRYAIPAILIAEHEDAGGTFEIIDELQRLHAIVSFVERAFPTEDGRYFDLDYFPTAKGRSDAGTFKPQEGEEKITQREVSTILDYSLALSIMRNATEAEIDDVFHRINTYGHRLSEQERRQAGVQNGFSEMVRDLACTLKGDSSADVVARETKLAPEEVRARRRKALDAFRGIAKGRPEWEGVTAENASDFLYDENGLPA